MRTILGIIALTVLSTVFYAYVAHLVPQTVTYPSEDVELSADMSTAEMVGVGQEIVGGKGTCLSCHTIGAHEPGRFPDLGGVGGRAGSRREGLTDLDYLAESLYDPNAYIVEGFSPGMIAASKPPVSLSDPEILAVIAYLQSLGGTPSVTMQTKLKYQGQSPAAPAASPGGTAPGGAPPGDATLFTTYGCITCHALDGPPAEKMLGPSLHDVALRLTPAQIYESILDPDVVISEGYTPGLMPATLAGLQFYEKVSATEIKEMVAYLASPEGRAVNLLILAGVVVALVAVRLLRGNMLAWLIAWWLGVFILVRFAVQPPLPSSIVNLFMGIISIALLTYLYSDSTRLEAAKEPLVRFLVDRKFTLPLLAVGLLIPALVAFRVYTGMSKEVSAPMTSRTIHPAPPGTMTFRGKTLDLLTGENPFRTLEESDAAGFQVHVTNGRRVYYQNCVFCHGDNLEGDGLFAHALDPLPADLAGNIGLLQESYLFWRIAKGGPGLPEESTPWSSAMPAWEQFLGEDEIWDVILFLYEHAGVRPREVEVVH